MFFESGWGCVWVCFCYFNDVNFFRNEDVKNNEECIDLGVEEFVSMWEFIWGEGFSYVI